MIAANMLAPLDHAKIPNIRNVSKTFMDAKFDPGRKYSLPYMWGTVGIGYRKSKVDGVPDSWKWLYDSDKYAGRMSLLGEPSTIFQVGCKFRGWPLNESDPARKSVVEGKSRSVRVDSGGCLFIQ